MITVSWPRAWASKGYGELVIGFETVEEAHEWHALFEASINFVRQPRGGTRKTQVKGLVQPTSGGGSHQTEVCRLGACRQTVRKMP